MLAEVICVRNEGENEDSSLTNSVIVMAGSVDVRSQLSPHPCLDFLVLEDPVTGRTNLSMSEARKAGVVCSPRGVAFSGYDTMLYLDGITANLVSFDYNVKERSLGEMSL